MSHSNIYINSSPESHSYSGSGAPIKSRIPDRDRRIHGEMLQNKFRESICASTSSVGTLKIKEGMYLEVIGKPGHPLSYKSLENVRANIKLMQVKKSEILKDDGKKVIIEKATIFIPQGKEHVLLKKIQDYSDENQETKNGHPKNKDLMNSIEDVRIAIVDSFWHGKKEWQPRLEKKWCEIWINESNSFAEDEIREYLNDIDIEVRSEKIDFSERLVLLANLNYSDLERIISETGYIAEYRRSTTLNSFFLDENLESQSDFIEELLTNINPGDSDIRVSLLDTGLNNGHVLLADFCRDEDLYSAFLEFDNYDKIGHGTEMAGIILYEDELSRLLSESTSRDINYDIESIKIVPDEQNPGDRLYGSVIADAISELIINSPDKRRVFCMATTNEEFYLGDGSPTAWSAKMDNIIFGSIDEIKKILFVSGGNIRETLRVENYPDLNLVETVEDPGQAWNAITVSAYTDLISNENNTLSKSGGLSPMSRTSNMWDKAWPIKPEIILEGGNAVISGNDALISEDLSLLTTSHTPTTQLFSYINGTSSATALASSMAAKLKIKYPTYRNETIRALMIHSASWTDEMKEMFLDSEKKTDYRKLLRTCGYGKPDLSKVIESVSNNVNMILEGTLQPFNKKDSRMVTNEMHIHEMPWPESTLLEMGDIEVKLKITLSYYIEASPGENGWDNKYRYASHGLRFALNGSSQKEDFLKRVNKAAREENETAGNDPIAWTLGKNNRDVGSIHSDKWVGKASDLALSRYIAIYPIIGWWRERPKEKKWDKSVNYSLVVSLETPEEDIDLLTPILVIADIPIEISN